MPEQSRVQEGVWAPFPLSPLPNTSSTVSFLRLGLETPTYALEEDAVQPPTRTQWKNVRPQDGGAGIKMCLKQLLVSKTGAQRMPWKQQKDTGSGLIADLPSLASK